MSEPVSHQRYHDLDFVRAAAMLLGLLLHVCIFFMPPERYFWGSGDYSGDILNAQFLNFIHLFRMQLFFLLAGFFAELVVDRKGLLTFVLDRLKRILLPFVVGVLAIVPIFTVLNGYYGYYNNLFDEKSILQIIRSSVLFGSFDLESGSALKDRLLHYWFVYYLLIFYLLYVVFRPLLLSNLLQKASGWSRLVEIGVKRWWGFLLLGLFIAPLQYSLKLVFIPPSGFNVPLADLGLYFLYFYFGISLYQKRHLLEYVTKNAYVYAAFSLPLFMLIDNPTMRIDSSAPITNDLYTWTIFDLQTQEFVRPYLKLEGVLFGGWAKVLVVLLRATLCWSMCLASIGIASRYLSKESSTVRYLADSAYWVYWIHLPLTYKLSYMFQDYEGLDPFTKCYLVLVVSTLLIYMSYQWCVRYTWLGNFFMGKKKSPSDPGEEQFRVRNLIKVCAKPVLIGAIFTFCVGSLMRYNRGPEDRTPLVEAYVARKQGVLDQYDTFEGLRDAFGNTPLHASQFKSEMLRRYNPLPRVIEGMDTLDHQNDVGRTALFYAVRIGNEADMKTLLDEGADPDIPDLYGHTPAHAAAILCGNRNARSAEKYHSILRELVKHGCDLTLKDQRGRTVEDCLMEFSGANLDDLID
ncbi:MAG: acyltransferase family protein [Planctomycetota bacterium]|nr:acyltransferase family protein [Planctomycetota bacterium]